MAMLQLLREMRDDGLTVHGFRSTFRDWAGNNTSFPREVIEAAMSHRIKDKADELFKRHCRKMRLIREMEGEL